MLDHLGVKDRLSLIRKHLVASKLFPNGLSGACYASAFLSDFILKSKAVGSEIVTSPYHCFNRFYIDGQPYILDLTATQISKNRFEEISVLEPEEAKSRLTNFKKGFYDEWMVFSNSKDLLLPRGDEALTVAAPLVHYLCTLIGEKDLLSKFYGLRDLNELDVFSNTLVSLSENHLNRDILGNGKSAEATPQKRKKPTFMEIDGP